MKKYYIECSNCGCRTDVTKIGEINRAIQRGWRSYGSVLYCPSCTATWSERNHNKVLDGEYDTLLAITENVFYK